MTATHVTAHTNHTPGPHEDTYLPLPKNIKFAVAVKLSHGIPAERIMEGVATISLCVYQKLYMLLACQTNLHVHMHTSIICTLIHMYVCMYIYVVCTYIHTYVYIHTCIAYIHAYTHTYVCTYVRTYIYVHARSVYNNKSKFANNQK